MGLERRLATTPIPASPIDSSKWFWLPEKAMQELFFILPFCTDIIVSIGLPVRFEGQLYNCACLVENGKLLGFTAKQFLANDGVHYEPRWFTPWQAELIEEITVNGISYKIGDVLYEVEGIKIGLLKAKWLALGFKIKCAPFCW